MKQIVFSYLSCFEVLNVLCRTIPGRQKKSSIIYKMVMFFSAALTCLQVISNFQSEHETSRNSQSFHHERGIEDGEFAFNKYLAQALACITHNLDWKIRQPGHSELLEGTLFSILEHTGRLLSVSVFQEHVAKAETAGNITGGKSAPFTRAMKLESRYIVQILHATIGIATRKELVAQVLMANSPHKARADNCLQIPAGSASIATDLVSKANILIQSTLVKSTIGGVGLESLKLPSPPEEAFHCAIETGDMELYGSDWLIGSVWALVGWDTVL